MAKKSFSQQMPDAWPIFFKQRKPRPLQKQAMPLLVRGKSVLLSGPTASGKTEAALTPLLQRHISFKRTNLSVIYVAPTKALVNDIYHRLDSYLCSRMPDSVKRYTGDRHDFKAPDGLFCLLTTPEALDSLQLTRPESLKNVRAIVVDEIHMLHGNARGQQLRHVIRRIEINAAKPKSPKDVFQKVGMTATLEDMDSVSQLWLGDKAETVKAGDPRDIEISYFPIPVPEGTEKYSQAASIIAQWFEETKTNKGLIFGNRKNSTQILAANLHEILEDSRWPIHWHIGDLTASERERVEDAMKYERFGICVATSTLEVGIDIGDLDIIILADPPFSINAFLQRIGRGNRKTDKCKVIALYNNEQELRLFQALHHCACNGVLDEIHEYDRASVRFQQIVSFAWHGADHDKPITRRNLSQRTGDVDHLPVIEDMLDTGTLEDLQGALLLSQELTDQGERRQIHTTISGTRTMNMVDGSTGETIISASGHGIEEGALFVGGKRKNVTAGVDGTVSLESSKNKKLPLSSLPAIRGKKGLGRRIVGALAEVAGKSPHEWELDGTMLITWGGADYNRLIASILKVKGITHQATPDEYGVNGIPEVAIIDPEQFYRWAEEIEQTMSLPNKDAAYFCERSRYYSYLSHEMQLVEAQSSVPFAGFKNWLLECQGIPPEEEDIANSDSEKDLEKKEQHEQADNDEPMIIINIEWSDEDENPPALVYAKAIISHLAPVASEIKAKIKDTPELTDLDLDDCVTLLPSHEEITFNFLEEAENGILGKGLSLILDKRAGNHIKLTIAAQEKCGNLSFIEENLELQWLQADLELHSPLGIIALPQTQKGLHPTAAHTLIGLATACGKITKSYASQQHNGEVLELGSWLGAKPSAEGIDSLPIQPYAEGSFWLPVQSKADNNASLWFVPSRQNDAVEKVDFQALEEELQAICKESSIDFEKVTEIVKQYCQCSAPIRPIPIQKRPEAKYLTPVQDASILFVIPENDSVALAIDTHQTPEILCRTILHGAAHVVLGHIRPGDEFAHSDTVESILGHGYQKRWDHDANTLLPKTKRESLADCTTEEKAMLGLWRMIGEVLGESRRLHPKAEAYQRAAYQRQAAQRLLAQMEEYGGAMLCDGVGLGKTYVATTVMVHYANAWRDKHQYHSEELLSDPFRITILAPNSVVSTWQREAIPSLASHGLPLATVRVISHTKLSRITKASEILEAPCRDEQSNMEHLLLSDLVIVDEAHNFRSLNARRSVVLRDLLRLQPRREQRRRVLLLTATPINNTLDDLMQETSVLFSKPLWLSDAVTEEGYRRQVLKEVRDRCKKARTPKAPKGDIAPLLIHGQVDARFSQANDFRDDLDFGPNVQRIGDYLREQDRKLQRLQQEIRDSAGNDGQHYNDEPARIAEELLDRIVVQRSRDLCKEIERQQGSDVELMFRADAGLPEKLRYSDEYDGTRDILAGFLPLFDRGRKSDPGQEPLSLKVYMWYDVREGIKSPDDISSVVGLQRILVLKRLESSPVSFLITLLRLTVLHAFRLQNLIDLCAKASDRERLNFLKKEIEKALSVHNKKDLDKIATLATEASWQDDSDFLGRLAGACEIKTASVETDDMPIQLSLFDLEDSSTASIREELERLWGLKDYLLQDFSTLLQVTPRLTDVVFGRFDRAEWPHYFTHSGKEVDWPQSPAWGMRIVSDAKLRTLVSRLLQARRDGQKVIVFSQFSDTLAYASSVLHATKTFTATEWRVVLPALGLSGLKEKEIRELIAVTEVITGGTEDRDRVVNAFAPYYRIGPFPPVMEGERDKGGDDLFGNLNSAWASAWRDALRQPIDVLFSSDVLAEGVNLQDAAVLINFDVHWNPVRMIQRSGRIDRRLNPRIEKARSYPELESLTKAENAVLPNYYWHGRDKEAPLTVNMILPDELEAELLLRERIAMKTLAIDFTLGLDQGTGAEADWMADYAYQGVSSLNAFQRDRAIEQVAGFHERFHRIFKERGIQPEWAVKLDSWFRASTAGISSPLVARAYLGRRGENVENFERCTRYLEPWLKDGIPYWCWAEKVPGESLYDGWLIMDGKSENWPPPLSRDIAFQKEAAGPLKAAHLLAAALQLESGVELEALPPQEFVRPFMQGATALAAPKLGAHEDRVNIAFNDIYILQLPIFDPEKLGRKIA